MQKKPKLSLCEREELSRYFAQDYSLPKAAKHLGRNRSTIFRELKRTGMTPETYRAVEANQIALKNKKIPRKRRKLEINQELLKQVKSRLKKRWSPEQIAKWLKEIYPDDMDMHLSHETIYTYIYILPRGSMKKELISYLRQGQKKRRKRKGTYEKRGKIPDMISIHERPKEVEDRIIPGHWESDLIIGKDHKSALGTIVERTTRTTILVPLKSYDAATVRKAFARELKKLPKQVALSMTHDRGKEMSEHKLFTKDTKIQVYFADPRSPWQRGTNENTNGLVRDFFPKGTDFNTVSRYRIKRVQALLNERPRKVIDWKTPKEVFNRLLDSVAF